MKLLEANELFVPLNVTQHWNKHDFVPVDVTDILFICAGTFADLRGGRTKGEIGFAENPARGWAGRVQTRDLEEYGLLPELLGRLPVVVEMQELTDDELGRILTAPPDAIWREYREVFEPEKIELKLTPDGVQAIVGEARRRRLGARDLRGVVEEMLADLSFHAPERAGETVVVDGDFVRRQLA